MIFGWLTDWKFWLVVAIVVIVILWIIVWLKRIFGSERDDDEESEGEVKHKKKKSKKRSKGENFLETCSALAQQYNSSRIPPPHVKVQQNTIRTVSRPDPLRDVDHNVNSSYDFVPDISKIPQIQPMIPVDLTTPIPSHLLSNAVKPNDSRDSQFEKDCRKAMENFYGVPFPKERPEWLINPKTGKRLELDGVNHNLKMGFEAHGRQHYVHTPKFQPTYQDFINQVERDRIKLDICDAHRYYIITIPYNCPRDKLRDFINFYDPSSVKARMDREVMNMA